MGSKYSVNTLASSALDTVRRFPFEVATAVLGTALALMFVHDVPDPEYLIGRGLVSAIVMMALHIAVSVSTSVSEVRKAMVVAARAGVILLGALVALFADVSSEAAPVQIGTLIIGAHAVVAIAPFKLGASVCWAFNRTLFLRAALAFVFSSVLAGGLSAAIGAVQVLFSVDVPNELYGDVNFIILGLFNTIIVLSGIPTGSDLRTLQPILPTALRWFVQFVLMPLVGIFLLILYAYGFDVIFFRALDGSVAGYVLTLGVGSLLAWALGWPLRDQDGHRSVSMYIRWLGVALLPVTALLLTAIGVRIQEYGITPERFTVVTLASFMSIVSIALVVFRRLDVRALPLTLLLLAVVTSFGPLSSASVTTRNQSARFSAMMTDLGVAPGHQIDTLAFQNLPRKSRTQAFEHLRAIAGIDTSSAIGLLRSYGIATEDMVIKRYGAVQVSGLGSITNAPTPRRDRSSKFTSFEYVIDEPDNTLPGIELSGRISVGKLSNGKSDDGAVDTLGAWVVRQGAHVGVLEISTLDSEVSEPELMDLRPMLKRVDGVETDDIPLDDRSFVSDKGRYQVILLKGTLTAMQDTLHRFSLNCLLIDRN